MKDQKKYSVASKNVRVRPEFNNKPDIEKLARVLIAVAKKKADSEECAGDHDMPPTIGKVEGVP